MTKRADRPPVGELAFLASLGGVEKRQAQEPKLPRHLEAFVRRGVQPGDDAMRGMMLALELSAWWRSQWARELSRRARAEESLAKLRAKKPRGRPRAELDLSAIAESLFGSDEPQRRRGAPVEWTNEALRRIYDKVQTEMRQQRNEGRRPTVTGALRNILTRGRKVRRESTSASAIKKEVATLRGRYYDAKKLFGNSSEKSRE